MGGEGAGTSCSLAFSKLSPAVPVFEVDRSHATKVDESAVNGFACHTAHITERGSEHSESAGEGERQDSCGASICSRQRAESGPA